MRSIRRILVAIKHPALRSAPTLNKAVQLARGFGAQLRWLHLNDWEFLRLSPVPVLLIEGSRACQHPVVLAAVDPSHSMDKSAKLDAQILRVGEAVTQALRGWRPAVRSYPRVAGGSRKTCSLDPGGTARLNAQIAKGARARYERALKSFKVPRSRRHLLSQSPADSIATLTSSLRSAIVVMGAVSRSGLKRAFIGMPPRTCSIGLTSGLLVVKPPRFKAQIPSIPTGVRILPLVLG